MQAWHIWIIIGIILSILEIFTAGFLIINFGIGAIIAGLAAFGGAGLKTQLIVFAISSLILFVLSRKFASRFLTKDEPEARTNVEALIGKEAIVTQPIGGTLERGQVKIDGEEWSAISETEDNIDAGEKVTVKGVDGNKLIVIKAE